jgi:hypothetical protein
VRLCGVGVLAKGRLDRWVVGGDGGVVVTIGGPVGRAGASWRFTGVSDGSGVGAVVCYVFACGCGVCVCGVVECVVRVF